MRSTFLKVLFPEMKLVDVPGWVGPGMARLVTNQSGDECSVGTDAVGFFLLFLVFPTSWLLLSGHHLVFWLLGSHLHRTYLLDGLILSSYFSGLMAWLCLVCLFLCPLSLMAWLLEDPGMCLPAPSYPVPFQRVCALPHSPLSLVACALGRGATPTSLFRFPGPSGKECDQTGGKS